MPYGISQACCSNSGDEFIGLKFPYKPWREGSGPWDTRTDALSSSRIGEWSECDREDWNGLCCEITGLLTYRALSHTSLSRVKRGVRAWVRWGGCLGHHILLFTRNSFWSLLYAEDFPHQCIIAYSHYCLCHKNATMNSFMNEFRLQQWNLHSFSSVVTSVWV